MIHQVLGENEAVTSEIVASAHIENYAVKLFNWADKEDRASNFGKNVVKAFYTAGNVFDILQVFGELTPEVAQRRKYAKWKAAYIHNCLKSGQQPVPGPLEDEEEEGAAAADTAGGEEPTQYAPEIAPPPVAPEPVANVPINIPPPVAVTEEPRSGSKLEPSEVLRVQKLCKFASSAMDYEDVDTAIKNLTEALALLQKAKHV